MMRNTPIYVALLLASSLALAQPAVAPQTEGQNPESAGEDPRAIAERHAGPLIESGLVPGLVVGVLREGERTHVGLGRLSDENPATPDGRTLFEIGSITKTFTATLLADASARGEVNIDDPIGRYLPDGVEPPSRGGVQPTLEQLAAHTSGLPRVPMNMTPENGEDPYADYTRDDLWSYMDGATLFSTPGETYSYSNLGAGLLGTLLARQAGLTYAELVRQRITEPLGLSNTVAEPNDAQRARFAQPHQPGGRRVIPWNFDALAGAGALRSTAADMLTWAEAQIDPDSTPLAEAIRITHEPRFNIPDRPTMIALGWHIAGDADTLVHDGGTGGSRSILFISQNSGIAVVVLANAADDRVSAVGEKIIQTLAGGSPEPIRIQADEAAADVPIEQLRRLTGVYSHELLGRYEFRLEDGRMIAVLASQPAIEVVPNSPTEFFYRVVEARLEFELPEDENSMATAVTLSQAGRSFRFERAGSGDSDNNGGGNGDSKNDG